MENQEEYQIYREYLGGKIGHVDIRKKYNITSTKLEQIMDKFYHREQAGRCRLGSKTTPYYSTEAEMVIPEYKYEELSLIEKLFYESKSKEIEEAGRMV
jgi:hypothetical protein